MSTSASNLDLRTPVSQTPLSQQGHSLQTGQLSADSGLISNSGLINRPQTAARVLNNLQQIIPGVWTSSGIGWSRQRPAAFNIQNSAGTPFREFAFFLDTSNNRTLVFQVYDTLYSYNIGTSTETVLLAGLNNSPTNTPCMRRSFSSITGTSILIYCNGDSQPQKVTSPTVATALGFNMKAVTTTPAAPTITNAGTAGATTYTYVVIPEWTTQTNGTSVPNRILSAAGTTTTGAATLTGANYNQITFLPVAGAWRYLIYRTAGGATHGLIGTVTSWTQSTVTPFSITFNDTGLVGDGTTTASQVTGAVTATTIQVVGTFPGSLPLSGYKQYSQPKFCEPYGAQRFVYGGFKGDPATAFDVVISSFAGPEDFTQTAGQSLSTDAVTFTYPPEFGELMGLKSFRLSNQTNDMVIIGACRNGVWQITGNSASNYALIELTKQFGILSNRTWVQLGNDMFFLTDTGYRNYSSLLDNAVLIPDEASNPVHDLFSQLDTTNAYLAHACHNPKTQEVQIWYPSTVDGGLCQRAMVMNYNGGVTNLKWSTRDGTTVNCSTVFNGVFYGGGNDGLLQQHYSGNMYDNQPMKFQLYLALMGVGNINQKASMRNLEFVTEGGSQQFLVTVYYLTKASNQKGKTGYRRFVSGSYPLSDQIPAARPSILGRWGLVRSLATFRKCLNANPREMACFGMWKLHRRRVS